jgi:hypothetical protein
MSGFGAFRPPSRPLLRNSDIIDIVLADHERIRKLFAELSPRRPDPDGKYRQVLSLLWDITAALLELHTQAEEEIWFPALTRYGPPAAGAVQAAVADDEDIREAIREAGLHAVGTEAWWRGVDAARRASTAHISNQQAGLLVHPGGAIPAGVRLKLGAQWTSFAAARLWDRAAAGP